MIHAAGIFLTLLLALPLMALAAPVDVAPYLQIKGQSGPSLSPDGTRVAFSFAKSGVSQVWVAPLAGGDPVELTRGPERADFKAWSPTHADEILFGRDQGGDENWQIWMAHPRDTSETAFIDEPGIRHLFGGYSFDGSKIAFASNSRNREFFDVYTTTGSFLYILNQTEHCAKPPCGPLPPLEDALLLMRGDGDNQPVAWSHDGNYLLVSTRKDNFNNDLLMIDVNNHTYLGRLLTSHEGNAEFDSCAFSGDDSKIYCVSDFSGRQYRGRAVIDLRGGAPIHFLPDSPHDVESLTLSRDGSKMAYVRNRDGYGDLIVVDVATDAVIAAPHMPPGVVAAPVFSAKGDKLAFEFSGPSHPSAIWTYDFTTKQTRQVTNPVLGGISQSTFVEPQLISYKSFDGLSVPAWYYKPRGASGKLPVIIDVHGGPEAQARPAFNPIVQFFLASGYAVLVPNVRGSFGYGNTYLHLADVRKRLDSVKDLHAAHDWLIAQGGADPKRIALYGGSYGGYMVLAGLTEFPDDWAAGVDVVGISNFVTFLEHTSPYRRANREAVYGSLANDRQFLDSISPLNHIDRIKAPLIIFMGQNDPRVPASEGQQMADALRAKGVPVELTIFPNEGHGIARDENRITAYTQIAQFLGAHLAGP